MKAIVMRAVMLALSLMACVTSSALAQPFAYIPNAGTITGDGTVSVIDTATNTVVATVRVGESPRGIAVSPDGTSVYVANTLGSSISVLDAQTNVVTATIPVALPFGVAITPDGARLYVVQPNSDIISIIDTSTNTVITTVPTPRLFRAIAISPDGRFAYLTAMGNVHVLDIATSTVIASVPIETYPGEVVFSPDGRLAYVTVLGSGIWIIDTATKTVADVVDMDDADGVVPTPDGKFLYVTVGTPTRSDVEVIATASRTVVSTIPIGGDIHGLDVTPDGRLVYVPIGTGSTVAVIDTATNTVIATVSVGSRPGAQGRFIGPAINRPPTLVDDSYTTSLDTPLNVTAPGVLANDSDPDGDPLTVAPISGPSHGTANLRADGSFTYAPAAGFTGTDSFTYRASDGKASATAVATIAVSYPSCGVTITPTTLAQPYVAVPYLQALGTTPGGKYTFRVTAGQLPPGLQLVSVFGATGIIGIPQASGTYVFTLTATRSGSNCRSSRTYTVTVPKTVVPLLTCVQKVGNNTYRGTFGFASSMDAPVSIPVSADNAFTPGAQNRGQVTVFAPGTVVNAFTVTFTASGNGNDIAIWFLRGPDGQRRPITITRATFGCQ